MALNILNSPFSEQQLKQINELYPTLTPYQKIWITGFLSADQLGTVLPTANEETIFLPRYNLTTIRESTNTKSMLTDQTC